MQKFEPIFYMKISEIFVQKYVEFQLGKEKRKSKCIPKTLNPVWNEQFDLHTFPDQSKVLELTVIFMHFVTFILEFLQIVSVSC
uniref:C2 domain-containing protein n=1 Tax=Tetranychus urticae TaxID=32264 RepID=T1KC62_TETUR